RVNRLPEENRGSLVTSTCGRLTLRRQGDSLRMPTDGNATTGRVQMIFRILTMHVKPERKEDWLRFTRDVGFPAMLKQPGCKAIWRLRERGRDQFKVMTMWESVEHLDTFNKSKERQELIAAANGFAAKSGHTDADEAILEVVQDPPR